MSASSGSVAGIVLLSVIGLAGCATSPGACDPDSKNLLTAAGGVLGGCYEERQRIKEGEVASERDENVRLRTENENLQEDAASRREQMAAIERRIARNEAEERQLRAELARQSQSGSSGSESLSARVDELRRERAELEDLLRSMSE